MLARLVDSSTPLPGGAGGFGLVGDLDLDAAGFAFTAPRPDSSVDDGIYRNLGDGIEVVADLSTIAPHSGTPFEDFRSFSYGSGAVAFTGVAGGETAVYLHDGTLRTIASQKTLYPGTGHTFDGFSNRVATSEGRVAFWGFRSPPGQLSREGLFVADGPDILTIVEAGRKLDGRVVSDFTLSSGAFDWPYLAFTVVFEDGGSALYRMNFAGEEDPGPPAGPWLTSPDLPGFRVQARISAGGSTVAGLGVAACIEETLCVSGALPDRAELFVRVVGPKPNGKLWPTLIKFSTSRIEVWIEQTATGVVRYYDLPAVAPGAQRLDLGGMADKLGFDP